MSGLGRALGGIVGGITGQTGADAARDAADINAGAQREGLEELKRQFGITQENLAPFLSFGTGAIPGAEQGLSVGGIDEMLGQIFGSDSFGNLREERERSMTGLLGASGNTRGGFGLEQIADVPTDLGLQLEQLLFGRNQNAVNLGQNTAVGAGTLGTQGAQGIAQSFGNIGATQGAGITNAAGAEAAGMQNLLNLGALAFSDPELKDNLTPHGEVGPLTLYEWDWTPEAEETIVGKFPTIGFLSTDVREHYPEYVSTFGGYDVINYPKLLERLENG